MTYGLSRDDAGRFMSAYVQQGVFEEDPFQELDLDGVGELLLLGAARGRAARPDVMLSMCGEHAGHPDSIGFCRRAGFDYVSCSPFRVPVANLPPRNYPSGTGIWTATFIPILTLSDDCLRNANNSLRGCIRLTLDSVPVLA
jgi:hypothetical protein